MSIREGTQVSWAWGQSRAQGKVTAVHHESVRRTIKGSQIVKHGSEDNPAYEIEQDDGTPVLKLRSEVEAD